MSAGPEERAGPPKVFISYRREDSAAYAGRLYDAVVGQFGEDNVFMDLELAPGVDFVEQITDSVGACEVLIEVIGPTWATIKDDEGGVRIANPDDFVRLELEIALRRPDVTVIPVLVAGARMPDRGSLPPELEAITRRNALEISDLRWRYDIGRLISTLEELITGAAGVGVAPPAQDVAGRAEAAAEAAPTADTSPVPARPADLGRAGERLRGRGRLLAALATLAVLGVGVVVAIAALGGGSGGGGEEGLDFETFMDAGSFTVDVPAGWRVREMEEPVSATLTRTTLESPAEDMLIEIAQEADEPAATRLAKARDNRSDDLGYALRTVEEQTVDDREAELFGYEIDEQKLEGEPSTSYTYFFNAGGYGWRTRAVGVRADVSPDTVLAIATRMAETLEPR
jgi:TIR domain